MAKSSDNQRLLREIGQRIRSARAQAGLTQEDAAAAAGIDYKRWQRLEQGGVNATVRTLNRVAGALGLSFWELVGAAPGAKRSTSRRRKA